MKFEISGLIVLFKDSIGYSVAILDTSLILKWIFFYFCENYYWDFDRRHSDPLYQFVLY